MDAPAHGSGEKAREPMQTQKKNGKWRQKTISTIAALLSVLVVCAVVPSLGSVADQLSILSAAFLLPDGTSALFASDSSSKQPPDAAPATSDTSSAQPAQTPAPSGSESEASSSEIPAPAEVPEENRGPISEETYENSGDNYGSVWIKNSTGRTIDMKSLLETKPTVDMSTEGPKVLIVHTHTTESYELADRGYYDTTQTARRTDLNLNMVRVGNEIQKQLEDAGIGVIHDTEIHDYPAYNGAYNRSGAVVTAMLEQYPSIQVVLDVHRDAITRSDGTKVKPTAVIDGKKAAQVMIISGCEYDNGVSYPNWEQNLRLAVRLQQSMADSYPGLARPLNFKNACYNQNLSPGSILLEFGTDANTLEEAVYSGELVGKCLAQTLKGL